MFLKNWRPISLINVKSKIATKVIIHSDQSGFMKGRFISETACSILDIIAHTEVLKLPGVLLFIDCKKSSILLNITFFIKD